MSAVYPAAGEAFLTKKIDWIEDEIVAVLLDLQKYSFDEEHQFLIDIPRAARIATSAPLAGKRVHGFTCYADEPALFLDVSGARCEALVVVQKMARDTGSRLIVYIDKGGKLPFTPNSGDVEMSWSKKGIFTL